MTSKSPKEQSPAEPREIEATLIVTASRPGQILDDIAALERIDSYQLNVLPDKRIHDRYFDTSSHDLRQQKLALRLRDTRNQLLVTLKGKTEKTGWGGLSRLEIEEPWGYDGLSKALSEIRDFSDLAPSDFKQDDPLTTLKNIGFELIQERETFRHVRNITQESSNDVLAELAIDRVEYRIAEKIIPHFEVEVESKSANGVSAVRDVSGALQKQFGSKLRPWPFSKLATGFAIEQLAKQDRNVMQGKFLHPDMYDTLANLLSNQDHV